MNIIASLVRAEHLRVQDGTDPTGSSCVCGHRGEYETHLVEMGMRTVIALAPSAPGARCSVATTV